MPEPTSKSVDLLSAISAAQMSASDLAYIADVSESDPDDFNRKATLSAIANWIANNLGTVDAQLRESIGADVASASTLEIGNDGNFFNVTGDTTINTIASKGVGTVVRLRFAAALQLTHSADLDLPGDANITTAAGDVATFYEYAEADWRLIGYQPAAGMLMLLPPGGSDGQVIKKIGGVPTWAADSTGSGSGPLNKLDATADPGTGDDVGDGYEVGSLWVNVTADRIWICQDPASGAAVWERIDQDAGILNNLAATTDPTTGDDSGDGYAVGSIWINVTLDRVFTCVDASVGAAVWEWTNEPAPATRLDKLDATTAPTTGDDSGDGYSVGSLWIDLTADRAYVCVDASSGAAVWLRIDNPASGPLNKLDATTAPTTGDDSGDGYSVGSIWIDVTADRAYICADATSTAAVWLRVDNTATFDPASPGNIGGTTPAEVTATKYKGSAGNVTLESSGFGATIIKGGTGTGTSAFCLLEFADSGGTRIGYIYHEPTSAKMALTNERTGGAFVFGTAGGDRLTLFPSGGLALFSGIATDPGAGNLFVQGDIKLGEPATTPPGRSITGATATGTNNQGGPVKLAGGAGNGTGAQGDVELEGDEIILDAATFINCEAPPAIPSYTYDTTPTPAPAGQLIRISDADDDTSGPLGYPSALAMSDGSYFRYVADNSIVGDV